MISVGEPRVVAGERPRTPKTMPSACEGLVRKAWHKLPSLRPSFPQLLPTLRAIEESLPLGAALEEHQGRRGVEAVRELARLESLLQPVQPGENGGRRRRRGRWWW